MTPTKSAAEGTTDALRALIARRQLRAGDRLPPERELCAALAVSRATVREAIGRLVSEGILDARPGSGTFIASINLSQIFEVRLQLEPHAAGLAAMNRSEEDLAHLTDLVLAMQNEVDDAPGFAARDAQLHAAVAAAAGNPVLLDVLERLAGLTRLSRSVTASEVVVRGKALDQILCLLDAIRDRDVPGAALAMRTHLESMRDSIQE